MTIGTSLRLLVAGALLSACTLAEAHMGDATPGQELKVKYGEELTVEGLGLRVKLAAVLEDSRCPTGVECVWEGDAKVQISARQGESQEKTLELHTNRRFNQEGRYHQYLIRLVALDPHPKADVKTEPKDYVATLVISKGST